MEKVPFVVQFTADQGSFQRVLNDLAASTKQIFITRTLAITNTDPTPAVKAADTPAPAAAAAAAPVPGEAAASPTPAAPAAPDAAGGGGGGDFLKPVVGTEKVDVEMRIDIVDFNPPERGNR